MNPLPPDDPNILDGLLDEWLGQKRPRPLSVESLSCREYSSARIAEFESALKSAQQERLVSVAGFDSGYRNGKKLRVRCIRWLR